MRAVAGGREEAADPGAAGPDPFGERALRHEFEREFACAVGGVEVVAVVLARKAADHLRDLAGRDESRQPGVTVAGVVVDHREVADAAVDERLDEFDGLAGGAETTDEHGVTVVDAGHGLRGGGSECGCHAVSFEGVAGEATFSSTTARP